MLIAVGIGLHNLGEGLAIGTAYTTGALALGAFLVVGFALHNTTEGLAIVAPIARAKPSLAAPRRARPDRRRARRARRVDRRGGVQHVGRGVPLRRGRRARSSQVIVQLAPTLRDDEGRTLHPRAVGGLLAGLALMFATGLLVSV